MKNCKTCGKPVDADAKFCPSCGAVLPGEEQLTEKEIAAAEMRQEQAEEKPSKKRFNKRTLIIAAILTIILISSAAAAIILHKSPKELYLLSEYKSYQYAKEQWVDQHGDSLEFQEKTMQQPSRSEMTLSGDVDMDSLGSDPDFEMVKELLGQASISAKMDQDPKTNQGHYTVALNIDKEKAMDVEMVQSKDQAGLKVPMLYDKFFFLNFDEYGEFMRMMDPLYDGPETLEISDLEWQDLKLTEKEQKHIQKRYGSFLMDNLDDDQFKVEKGVEYKHEGDAMKVRKVTLKLSASETKTFIDDLMDEMIKDTELHNILVKRAQKVAGAAALTEQVDEEMQDTKAMKRQLVDGLKDVKGELKDIRFAEGFTSTLLIDKKERIIDRKVTTSIGDSSDQVNVVMKGKNIPYGDDQAFKEFSINLAPDHDQDTEVMFSVTNDAAAKKEKRTEDLKAAFMFKEFGDTNEIKFTMKSDIKEEKAGKQDITRTFNLDFDGADFSDMPSAWKGTVEQKNDLNIKDEYSNSKFKMTVGLEDASESGSVTINLDSKTKLKDKVDMQDFKLDSGQGLSVVDISPDEMYEIQQEVGTNLMELGMKYGLISEDMFDYDYGDEASYDGYYDFEDEDSDDAF
ncbi:zinc-ribbon domain-containing protein [Peribacillus sp. NPDC097284]|uniref:zinc-ribbon domain-containing protein n=1 Tax=Peribacillus sp. NPDC097284 TaxID=3364401 RepID=UPI0037F89ED8